jgi:hypothetical protein
MSDKQPQTPALDAEQERCKNGHVIDSGQRYCPDCGSARAGRENRRDVSWRLIRDIRFLVAIGLLAIIGVLIFVDEKGSDPPSATGEPVATMAADEPEEDCVDEMSYWVGEMVNESEAGLMNAMAEFGRDSPKIDAINVGARVFWDKVYEVGREEAVQLTRAALLDECEEMVSAGEYP